ncbi:bifunctional non-homologous end joining protein LigD [Ureibacillus xyleni]|uniref:DNA ligase (ATP) n=1 Tax=Ureibacillus xyleni TaxID=614648 RepID=A0A285RVS3_9BACL|nr:DNA ligase D [Ureibacillus xyleni]SOB98640.1 bifunctional non-homologous end joining protein LigD [Ureibacillus xyleni]
MKPMLLTATENTPTGNDWIYETKYDGFRCLVIWEKKQPKLISRNEKELNGYFPELIQYCEEIYEEIAPHLPLILDGEIVYLTNNYKSQFSIVQKRGRTKTEKTIQENAIQFPCNIIVFDLLMHKGNVLEGLPLIERKLLLHQLKLFGFPDAQNKGTLQLIKEFHDADKLWNKVKKYHGEGIIAKKKTSVWESGKRSNQWLKIKNWRIVTVILTQYDQENGYFNGAVFKDGQLEVITNFRHGLLDEEMGTLSTFFLTKGTKTSATTWELPPSICVDVACIDYDGKKLREPRFDAFRFDTAANDVTWEKMLRQLNPLPETITITHPDKPVWPAMGLVKDDYIYYLQQIAPYMLPFLKNRLLTAIRFPHGVPGESFYQKNAPDYTPEFIKTMVHEEIEYIICHNIESLLWLGNQLAIEFHIPFQTVATNNPTEIVFDLDPPSVDDFSLAIEAATRMKAIFDNLNLTSFVKTSGGKGLQIYIPLPKDAFTYDECRIFTEFVCRFLCEQEPKWFTTERLKKNRNNKLYLDYVQHAEGKTIISPYSARGNDHGYVATPLLWSEVDSKLSPKLFPIPAVLERISSMGDPFKDFFKIQQEEEFRAVLTTLRQLKK